jgi:hypothetical protein
MKPKLKRFAIQSLIMTAALFVSLMLLDLHRGEAWEKLSDNMIFAALVGIFSATPKLFCKQAGRKPGE